MAYAHAQRQYCDRYVRGDQEIADRFIRKLERTKEAETKFSFIYNEYVKYMKHLREVPVSSHVFINLLKDHGITIESSGGRGSLNYIAVRYIPENTDKKEEKLESAIDELDTALSDIDLMDLDVTSIESFQTPRKTTPSPSTVIEFPKKEENTKEVKKESLEDSIIMKQIEIVESFAEIARLEFEKKMLKLDKLKEELIEKEMGSTELLDAIKKVLN